MNPNNPQGFGRPSKPDINDLKDVLHLKLMSYGAEAGVAGVNGDVEKVVELTKEHATQILKALYHRLAAEAVTYTIGLYGDNEEEVEAVPLSKLKAIMEIKE